MPAPDLIAPDRLEELLGGALPEGEREARLQGLVRELRVEAPPAPPTLLERVREIGQEPPRRRRIDFLPRRRVLVLAALLVVLAAFAGLLSQVDIGGDDEGAAPAGKVVVAAAEADAPATPTVPMVMPRPAPPVSVEEAAKDGDTRASTLDRDTLGSRRTDGHLRLVSAEPGNRRQALDGGPPCRRRGALRRGERLHDDHARAGWVGRRLGDRHAGKRGPGRAGAARPRDARRGRDRAARQPRHRHRPAGRDRRPAGGHRPSRGPHRDPPAGDQGASSSAWRPKTSRRRRKSTSGWRWKTGGTSSATSGARTAATGARPRPPS